MAPIRHPNSRVEAIEKIRDIMQLNAPSEEMIEAAEQLKGSCDPYTKFLIDYYLEIEKQRMQFFKIAGPIFEGRVLPNGSNHDNHVNNKLRGSMKNLSIELVTPKFVHPIEKAACELNVSEATLSLWCRISGISCWPYRKLNSIDMLIRTIQEIGSVERDGDNGVENAIKMLEEEKKTIMENPSLALKENTKVMRKKMQHLASMRRSSRRNVKNYQNQIGSSRHVADEDNIHYLLGQELRDKNKKLSFELVAPKFGISIERAAKELRVHKKTLQIWCRIHDIRCRPYKKIQSIKKLITNLQELGHGEQFGKEGCGGIIQQLEEEMIAIKSNPEISIQASTLALMKDVTKIGAKRRKLMKGKGQMHENT